MPDRVSKPLNWERIQQIFDEASQLPPAQRQDWVAEACQGDRTLYLQVESLLLALDHEGGFLEGQIASYAARVTTGETPERIGAYRILSEIGRGGMGAVYAAERADGEYQRRVAIKLVQGGLAPGRELLSRFRMERQILAGLQHPNIAQLLDAGVTDDGVPYLVMEYVEGVRIDQYCDSSALSLRGRIDLFRQVCSAVQYAHRNLVVHRDIKPSNILVTLEGVPKLLDFGIAKLLRETNLPAGELEPATIAVTAPAERLMTREYASPEQIRGLPITTAADVYALGIVLYGLLTGRHPFAAFRSDFIALEHAICETEARPPSAAVPPLPPTGVAPDLRGDLDAIVLKAIRKEPGERYVSADQLSEDLNSYLNGFPVMARRGTRRYRAAKFIRRHRLGMVFAAAFVVVLLAFGTGMSLLAARLARERTRSNLEAVKARQAQETAEAVNQFLQKDLLAQASTLQQAKALNAKADPELTVRKALDRAASAIDGKFDREPLVEASIRRTIGQTYVNMGLFPEAQHQWESSLDLFRRFAGKENADTLDVMRELGDLYMREGRYAQAQQLYGETLELDRRALGPEHKFTIGAMYSLGVLYTREGNYPQAESLLAETLNLSLRVSGEMDGDSVGLMRDLANAYSEGGKYAEAEQLFQKALEVEHRLFGPEYNDILVTKLYLARLYDREGKYAEAEQLAGNALSSARRVLGETHPTTAFLTGGLADVYFDEGKYRQAQALSETARDLERRLFGEENPNTLTSLADVARSDQQQGRYVEAERLYAHTLEIRRRISGEEHPSTLRLQASLAALYDQEGKYTKAESILTSTSSAQRRVLGESHPETLASLAALGHVQLKEAKYAEAEATLHEALDSYRRAGLDSWQRYSCENLLGRSLAAQNRFAEAEPLEVSGYRGMVQRSAFIPAPHRYLLKEAEAAASYLGPRRKPPYQKGVSQ